MVTAHRRRRPHHEMKAALTQHHKKLYIIVAVVFVVLIGLQLMYPRDRALPLAQVNGRSIAWSVHDDIAVQLQQHFTKQTATLKVGSYSTELSLGELGAVPDVDTMIDQVTEYPLWQRLLPLSWVFRQNDIQVMDVYFGQSQLEQQASLAAKKLSHVPQNARLAIEDGKIVASKPIPGYEVSSLDVMEAISSSTFRIDENPTVIEVSAKRLVPARSSQAIAPVRAQVEAAVAKKLSITGLQDEVLTPNASTIASWLTVVERKDTSLNLRVDTTKVEKYVDSINDTIAIEPGVTTIQLRDGIEVSRTTGEPGRAIVKDELVAALGEALFMEPEAIEIPARLEPVMPQVTYATSYSSTQSGLRAYIDAVAASQDVRISLVQIGGNGWTADARAYESTPSASTYKLFVALVLFDKIDTGKMSWGDSMLDTNVAGCFERMVVASTNPCAEKFIAMFGREYINNFLYARGFSTATTFISSVATHSSVGDLTKFMIGLNNGTLVSGAHRDRLLSALSRHYYQAGIPAGSNGRVYDKVGFLWDYVHDTAIVYHPRGTYVVSIMTRGQSYATIAAITRQLERIMYP